MVSLAVRDATPRDPTYTKSLRRGFRASAEMRRRQFRARLRQVVIDFDALGLGGGMPGLYWSQSQRLRQFTEWMKNEARITLVGNWADQWIVHSLESGYRRAKKEVAGAQTPVNDRLSHSIQVAHQELEGIAAATVQKIARVAASVRNMRPSKAFQLLVVPLDTDISNRLKSFANSMTVAAHNNAKIDTYAAAGISKVGVTPETPTRKFTDEAPWEEDKHPRGEHGRFSSVGSKAYTEKARAAFMRAGRLKAKELKAKGERAGIFTAGAAFGVVTKEGLGAGPFFSYEEAYDHPLMTGKYKKPFYHGTTQEVYENIKKNGLVPKGSPGADKWAEKMNGAAAQEFVAGDRMHYVYIADKPDVAASFAKIAAEMRHQHPTILEIKVPPTEAAAHLAPDEASAQGMGMYHFDGTIKPEWIKGEIPFEKYKHAENMLVSSRFDEATKTLYLIVFTDEPAHDSVPDAAGVLFVAPSGQMLFMRRTDTGEWSIPAGCVEPDEDAVHAAHREAAEETGFPGDFSLEPIDRRTVRGVDFTTFVQYVPMEFAPILNEEHDRYLWSRAYPWPMHPGLEATLKMHTFDGAEPVRDADEDDDLVGILTAGDDLVCEECQDMADDSPYTLEEAQDMIPVHPNCRCAVYPWFDERYAGD